MTKPFICKSNLYPQQHTECPGNHCPRASGFLQDSREEMQVLQVTFWSLLKMLSNGIKAVFKGRCQYRKDLQNLGAKTWFLLSDSKLSRDTSIKKKITTTKKHTLFQFILLHTGFLLKFNCEHENSVQHQNLTDFWNKALTAGINHRLYFPHYIS